MSTDVDEQFALSMAALAEAFGVRITETRIRMYAEALGDLGLASVMVAIRRAVRECSYFPQAAELRRMVVPPAEDAALLAWSGFQVAASSVGAYSALVVDDAAAALALLQVFGSWSAYCQLEDIAVAAKRVEFQAAYRQALRLAQERRRATLLPGLLPMAVGPQSGPLWVGHMRADGTVRPERAQEVLRRGEVDDRLALEPGRPEGGDPQEEA